MNFPRFYPIIDTARLSRAGVSPVEFAEILAAAGVKIVQYRHKGEFTRARFAEAEQVGKILQRAGVKYIINDRTDIALMLGADGVHVGQDDLPPAAVRAVAGDRLLIGFSTHNREQLLAANDEPVDYLAIGPIFATASKENPDPVVGTAELVRIHALARKPLVAIGGITRSNALRSIETGVDSLAVISDLLDPDPRSAISEWRSLLPA
jgi:thiamine-phosphate pyrophosphorylase